MNRPLLFSAFPSTSILPSILPVEPAQGRHSAIVMPAAPNASDAGKNGHVQRAPGLVFQTFRHTTDTSGAAALLNGGVRSFATDNTAVTPRAPKACSAAQNSSKLNP